MKRGLSCLLGLVLLGTASAAFAQGPSHRRIEITPYGGWVWTSGYDVLLGSQKGQMNLDPAAMWGLGAGYCIKDSLTQIELFYNRQDTKMTIEIGGDKRDLTDVAVDYLQIGGSFGTQREGSVWFTSVSLGTMRFAPEAGEDQWRFSMIFGLGAKHYFNRKVGLRLLGRAPFTWVEDSAKFLCTDEGCLKSAGGRGVWQFDVSLGLVIVL
jgi:hypothetical protein